MNGPLYVEPLPMWQALLGGLVDNTPILVIAARFHKGLAAVTGRMVEQLRDHHAGPPLITAVAWNAPFGLYGIRCGGRRQPSYTNDTERIRAAGCGLIQVNTGAGCHLEADTLARGTRRLDPQPGSMLFIEDSGNLACPALFDLGERAEVVVLSAIEGEDKPMKYPHMFRACRVMLLNNVDLLPHVRFDVGRCIADAREVNPEIHVLRVSAKTGEGMDAWHDWLRRERVRQPSLAAA